MGKLEDDWGKKQRSRAAANSEQRKGNAFKKKEGRKRKRSQREKHVAINGRLIGGEERSEGRF